MGLSGFRKHHKCFNAKLSALTPLPIAGVKGFWTIRFLYKVLSICRHLFRSDFPEGLLSN